MEKDQEYIEQLVKPLCDHPDDVKTERRVDARGVFVILKVNKEDVPYLIGRQGFNAIAIKSMIRMWGKKNNETLSLRIEQPTEYLEQRRANDKVVAKIVENKTTNDKIIDDINKI